MEAEEVLYENYIIRKLARYRRHPVAGWRWATRLETKQLRDTREMPITRGWAPTLGLAKRAARFAA